MAIFADVVDEWKKAGPKEKLLIVGVSVGAIGLALYLHSKSTSSVAGTGTAGLPTSFQQGTGTTGTGTTPPATPTKNPTPPTKPILLPANPLKKPAPPTMPPTKILLPANPLKKPAPPTNPWTPPAKKQPVIPKPQIGSTTSPGYTGYAPPPGYMPPTGIVPKPQIGNKNSPAYTGYAPPPSGDASQGPSLPSDFMAKNIPVAKKPPARVASVASGPRYATHQPSITTSVAARINHPAALRPINGHGVPTGYHAMPAAPKPGAPKPAPIPMPPTHPGPGGYR